MRHLLLSLLTLLACAPLAAAAPSAARAEAFLRHWEGYRQAPYADGRAVSVGIGHNLTASGQRPKARYTHSEVMAFFYSDLSRALSAARRSVVGYDALPEDAQLIVLSLIWTLGPTGFHRWADLRLALSRNAWTAAAHELHWSKWAKDVGPRRRDHHVQTLLRL